MPTTSHTSVSTWDKKKMRFKCCGSKAAWRHKVGCTAADGKLPPDEPEPTRCGECGAVRFANEKPCSNCGD